MSLRLRFRNGDSITQQLASDLSLGNGEEVSPVEFDICREFAFGSDNPAEFSHWYLRSEVLRKFDDGNPATAEMRVSAATQKFHDAEALCREANAGLVGWDLYARYNLAVWRRARAIVRDILGPFPWERFPYACQFGPGASLELPRRKASMSNKWGKATHITEASLPYYDAFRKWSNIDLPTVMSVVDGNRVTTVPKSYATDRTIAIEPAWNSFFQKGVGSLIRSRLRRIGILLPDAQQTHQDLARVGSATGMLATIDLSMASDSVGLALCEALLPEQWYKVILDLRSPRGYLTGGEVVDYAKVSSMGNGFTFELETLLFYALTAACYKKDDRAYISVYGDDIICPTSNVELVMSLLREAGFQLNEDKSFWTGSFRESCGGHYFSGVDVTPFYLRAHPSSFGNAIVTYNSILEWCSRQPGASVRGFEGTLQDIYRRIPRSLRGPWGLDGCLWATWDQCRPEWSRRYQCYRQKTVKTVRWLQDDGHNWGAILNKLWVGNEDTETSWTAKADKMEILSNTLVYPGQWDYWPVRLA